MTKTATDTGSRVLASLKRRRAAEKRFRFFGMCSLAAGCLFLVLLFTSIFTTGLPAFQQGYLQLSVEFSAQDLGLTEDPTEEAVGHANYDAVLKKSMYSLSADGLSRQEKRDLYALLSGGAAYDLRAILLADINKLDTRHTLWLQLDDDVTAYVKRSSSVESVESAFGLNQQQVDWIEDLISREVIELRFNTTFFTAGDSREPELAGIKVAFIGSLYSMLIALLFSFPIGVAAAIYLQEFAPKNRWVDIIEVNINNLAAVPSIVFGLLGLAVFINFFGLPRSAPLVGGLVLTLMTLPTIIISARAALQAVPPSIREAAYGIGASKMQTIFHHVIPLAMPGMLTGTIIGMAQALGETAPLLMIGMVAFIVDTPASPMHPATALPVQIYLWADSPERGFTELTSAAIMLLLLLLVVMNAAAVLLRKKFERRWN